MIDLTTRHEDKDYFITKVYMKEDSNLFYIHYASGRIEERPFSIHNLNATFLQMEEQFMQYKEDYVNKVVEVKHKACLNQLIELLVGMGTIFLTTSMDMPLELKLVIDMIIVLFTLWYQYKNNLKDGICNTSINVILTAEEFLKNKEMFMTRVINPKTNEEEDWYLVTLSEIEEFVSSEQLLLIGKGLTPAIKKDESDRTNKVLKKIYSMGDEENA